MKTSDDIKLVKLVIPVAALAFILGVSVGSCGGQYSARWKHCRNAFGTTQYRMDGNRIICQQIVDIPEAKP